MKEFDQLVATLDKLLSPEGCPWDREQTMLTLRESVLEETCELIEAVDLNDDAHIIEELGDALFNFLFFCKVAEKERRFKTQDVLLNITEKLVRRHPHVFGDAKIEGWEQFWKQWESIKSTEKGKDKRDSIIDGIPKGLPALARAQKMLKKTTKAGFDEVKEVKDFDDEASLGNFLMHVVSEAQGKGLDAEQALRRALAEYEQRFREWEVGTQEGKK